MRRALAAVLLALAAIGCASAQEQKPETETEDYVILRASHYKRMVWMVNQAVQQVYAHHAEIQRLRAENAQLRVEVYRCKPELHPPPAPTSFRLSPIVRF